MIDVSSAALGFGCSVICGLLLAAVNHRLTARRARDQERRNRLVKNAEIVGAVRAEVGAVRTQLSSISRSVVAIETKQDQHIAAIAAHQSQLDTQGDAILETARRLDAHIEQNSTLIDRLRVLQGGANG